MRPQKRLYTVTQTPTTETALHQIYMGHVFLTIPEVAPDGSWARVRALYNPLVLWVWYGGGVMAFGSLLNIFRPRRKEVYSAHVAASPSAEPLSPMPQLSSKRTSQEP